MVYVEQGIKLQEHPLHFYYFRFIKCSGERLFKVAVVLKGQSPALFTNVPIQTNLIHRISSLLPLVVELEVAEEMAPYLGFSINIKWTLWVFCTCQSTSFGHNPIVVHKYPLHFSDMPRSEQLTNSEEKHKTALVNLYQMKTLSIIHL